MADQRGHQGECRCGWCAYRLARERDEARARVAELEAGRAELIRATEQQRTKLVQLWYPLTQTLGLSEFADVPEVLQGLDSLRAEVEQLKAECLKAVGAIYSIPAVEASLSALAGIRWALADLGLHVKEDAEATRGAVEVLCVQLRREARVWTGESLGAVTSPSQMQSEDKAALKERVFTALGAEILYRLERHHNLDPDLVAQFDLLGRDL